MMSLNMCLQDKLLTLFYCNGPNIALPTNFTRNNHEAYQRQINSQFFVTQLAIEPGTHWLKDKHANE